MSTLAPSTTQPIANVIDGSYVTGQELRVDGGFGV